MLEVKAPKPGWLTRNLSVTRNIYIPHKIAWLQTIIHSASYVDISSDGSCKKNNVIHLFELSEVYINGLLALTEPVDFAALENPW